MYIEIVRRPAGEAPEWVRDAWIGLSLPLAMAGRQNLRAASVLENSQGFFGWLLLMLSGRTERLEGYVVIAKDAVDILDAHDNRAACWWRENTPQLLDGRQTFLFDVPCCEPRGG